MRRIQSSCIAIHSAILIQPSQVYFSIIPFTLHSWLWWVKRFKAVFVHFLDRLYPSPGGHAISAAQPIQKLLRDMWHANWVNAWWDLAGARYRWVAYDTGSLSDFLDTLFNVCLSSIEHFLELFIVYFLQIVFCVLIHLFNLLSQPHNFIILLLNDTF